MLHVPQFGRHSRTLRLALCAVLCAGLTWFYVAAASTHARTINTLKSRGDQTGYLIDAKRIYSNWHRHTNYLIGERMRMPAYPAFLAALYSPAMSDDEFFVAARVWNIWLSLALLTGLALLFARFLEPLAALNLTLVVAFGVFIFKAGYTQPELLAYALFFAMFLACCVLLVRRHEPGAYRVGVVAGVLAGATHLTKAVMPPFLGLYAAVYVGQELWGLNQARRAHGTVARAEVVAATHRLGALSALVVTFLAVVSPYILTSKEVFGEYFFNVNTAYYIWYDTGAQARALLLPHTDTRGVISIPVDQLPTMSTYLATRTPGQILQRFTDGLTDMLVRSYTTFGFARYLLVYLAATAAVLLSMKQETRALVRQRAALLLFLVLYALTFTASTAFFSTISGTGTGRFLLMHVAPLLFVLAYVLQREPFRQCAWNIAGTTVGVAHVQLLVTAMVATDLLFTLWPRLMTTYGGF